MIPLFVTGQGAVTALGLDAARTVASLRAGMDGMTELPFAGETEQDLRAQPVQGFAEGVLGPARFVALAERALGGCIDELTRQEPRTPTLFVGLPVPGSRPGVTHDLELVVREGLERRFALPPGSVRTVAQGRCAVFAAVKQAEEWLRSGPHACIVGGVDSLLHPDDLRQLSARGLLAEEYDGFFPGEAAAFVCLSRRHMLGPWGRKAAAVVGFGDAVEPADGSAEHPLVGVGMAAAMRAAVADSGIGENRLGLCINAVNGTRAEWEDDAHARIRLLRVAPAAAPEIWHLASFLGETGAAYGALALLWANAAAELGIESASAALLSASEGARRAALVVQCVAPELMDGGRAPAISLGEPAQHVHTPIGSTAQLADDPGMRLAGIDDRHARLAEHDLDQLASLLVVRSGHLRSHSRWTDIESFERRALAHLDALAWSASFVRELVVERLERESEDAAAATMVLCCAPPRGDELTLLLAACERSDEHRARIAEAAALCPRAVAEPFLLALAEQTASDGLRDSLWALSVAQWATPKWLHQKAQALGRPTPDLIAAIGGVADGPNAWPLPWLTSLGIPLPRDAALAGMVFEDPRSWIDSFPPDEALAMMPEAMGVSALQLQRRLWPLVARLGAPTRGAVVALGWSGEVEGTQLLLEALAIDDDDIGAEAARSLARIYGLQPIETVVNTALPGDPDAAESAPPDDEAPSPTLAEARSDRLSRNRAQWEDALAGLPIGGDGRQRPLRRGRPWGRTSALQMIQDPHTPCSDRAIALWEHAITLRQPLAVHPRQWVARQRRLLAQPSTA